MANRNPHRVAGYPGVELAAGARRQAMGHGRTLGDQAAIMQRDDRSVQSRPLPLGGPDSGCAVERPDFGSNQTQVVVELMITARRTMDAEIGRASCRERG